MTSLLIYDLNDFTPLGTGPVERTCHLEGMLRFFGGGK